ncbi:ATP-binding protein [Sulfuriflexus sp.]|uniref:ATP-binding protein n=1 Tax=Sulfuriflexus sp. TaxID=2015443 RepID=UPI0028CC4E49|nr:ATP-binding protein [Sulfuriflexus sp.]MDT8405182.1 ATP-binding protein [Sulfuriflexus sp.]
MNWSLNTRTIIGASLVLSIFVILTAVTLDRAFEESARAAVEERLRGQLYFLIGETEVDEKGLIIPPASSMLARLNQPQSGLYASIYSQNKLIWSSRSALGAGYPFVAQLSTGEERFEYQQEGARPWFILAYGVAWQVGESIIPITYTLVEDSSSFLAQVHEYRQTLWGWLVALAILLLIAQLLILRWGLAPLRRVANEVQRIEQGKQDSLYSDYPRELRGLTDNLNTLLAHERAQQQRYRNALADLAHSLKTPLAVLHGTAADATSVREQVQRMQQSVDYQLQRAATAGRSGLNAPVELQPLLASLLQALHKVHAGKAVAVQQHVDKDLKVRMDKGDVTELLGNLLDNAFKWCRQQVCLRTEVTDKQFILQVEDDGQGIASEQVEHILSRGVRADESVPGHGIGLTMVRDIVAAYEGSLQIDASPLGGARFTIRLPR